jgi:hypothetical protein
MTTNKRRLAKLESAKTHAGAARIVVMWDADGDTPAKFDGVEMTQAEAEQKAAALPDNVQLLHVKYDEAKTEDAQRVNADA